MSIKTLGKQTVIYGMSHVVARVINFFLLPLYTHRLSPEQYGTVTLVFLFIAFANILYLHGMDSSLLRFFGMERSVDRKRIYFSHSWGWLLLTSIIFCGLMWILVPTIAGITIGGDFKLIIKLAIGILFFDTLTTNPKIVIRLSNRPLYFVIVEMTNVLVILALNIWWIGFQGLGIEYIFLSNLIASGIVMCLVAPLILKQFSFQLDLTALGDLLKFALPYIPAGLASITMELIDRYMLKWMIGTEAVGIYSAGYKLGIFMLLIVMGFKFAWQPFYLERTDDPDSPKLFARITTYYLIVSLFIFLTISFFIDALVRMPVMGKSFFGEAYWKSTIIVPVILLAYVFLGLFVIQLAGIYIRKKSGWIPVLNGSAAVVNVVANWILIRRYGWQGAAYATLIGYMFLVGFQYIIVRRFYPLQWEWIRVGKLIGIVGGIFLLWVEFSQSFLQSAGLIILFPLSLFSLRFFQESEVNAFWRTFRS